MEEATYKLAEREYFEPGRGLRIYLNRIGKVKFSFSNYLRALFLAFYQPLVFSIPILQFAFQKETFKRGKELSDLLKIKKEQLN